MAQPAGNQRTNNAPRLTVPEEGIISVEHPCIVKNAEKAIDMLGGPIAIAQVVQEGSDKTFALSFRPQDPTSKTIIANKKSANNVLLKISVPKRTGRKRKRGSSDPWTEDSTTPATKKDAKYLVNSMADNVGSYKVTALSTIPTMHMWRSMPDFVYSTSHVKILQDAKDALLSQHYPSIKTFEIPHTYGIEDTTTLPPPIWSNQNMPQSYTYRQNPSVKVSHDPVTGRSVIGNTQAPPKTYTYQIAWDDVEYPTAVMPGITPLEKQTPIVRETVAALQALFEERPIWSRRALLNCLPSNLSAFNVVRFCLGYVSFAIRSGPWRDTLVRLGVDPRTDPKYRVYQTIMLQLVPKANQLAFAPGVAPRKTHSYKPRPKIISATGETSDLPTSAQIEKKKMLDTRKAFQRKWTHSENSTSHVFDGQSPLPPDGKVWQLCDFTDSQLVALRDIPEVYIRATCETRYFGWYENGTNAKIRVVLKAKVEALAEGQPLDPELLASFMQLPEKLAYEVDTDAATNAAGPHSQQTENPPSALQAQSPKPSTGPAGNTSSTYLGDDPTQQQLGWAAAYRAFAKTELGSVPASGASGKGRLTKSKPLTRQSYLPKKPVEKAAGKKANKKDKAPTAGQSELVNDTNGATQEAPIDVDARPGDGEDDNDNENDDEDDMVDGPDVGEGEEILPSIEVNGLYEEEDEDSELGLDDEEPEIKIEDEELQMSDRVESIANDGEEL